MAAHTWDQARAARWGTLMLNKPHLQTYHDEQNNMEEVELAQRGISMLIEKPISSSDPDEVSKVADEPSLPASLFFQHLLFLLCQVFDLSLSSSRSNRDA